MEQAGRRDVLLLGAYVAITLGVGSWLAPWLYNAGLALAEIAGNKPTNGLIEWVAAICRTADAGSYHRGTILVAAVVGFLPWVSMMHGGSARLRPGPWALRLPAAARPWPCGQSLRSNLRGPWHLVAGFLLVAGIALPMTLALVPAGWFSLRAGGPGLSEALARTLMPAFAGAIVMETLFRGAMLGILLRALPASRAIALSALLSAFVVLWLFPPGLDQWKPAISAERFPLARAFAGFLADPRKMLGDFLPLVVLGLVLAHTRWRFASLWLPIGLHTGWRFTRQWLQEASAPSPDTGWEGAWLQQGIVPMTAVILAGLLACHLLHRPSERSDD